MVSVTFDLGTVLQLSDFQHSGRQKIRFGTTVLASSTPARTMGSPPLGEEREPGIIHGEAPQNAGPPTENALPSHRDSSSMPPIKMTEIDEHPPAEAPQISQKPPLPIATDTTDQASPPLPLKETQPNTQVPLTADLVPAPPREPLIITSASSHPNPLDVAPYPLTPERTGPAIGPSSDKSAPPLPESEILGPSLLITLLLISGARHPYKIDEKYLKKRNVNVDGNNPVNMSVYTLKELIWREWRDDWEMRPSSPGAIRLIYYGKMLEDKSRLHDCRFVSGLMPHVVHMTIKPQEIIDEEDAKIAKTGSRDREGNEGSTGCRCVIL
ncbi:MAG: hypothetical protein L6R40_004163 [Gallowayella cf. fulva]|nr:MAG: hypothetical protein L6R40_004163 [Xanthomendoza cf. fulva]